MRESVIEVKVCRYAAHFGWKTRKLITVKNDPDRLFFRRPCEVFFAEFKQLGVKPREGQAARLSALAGMGFAAHVIDSVDVGESIINEWRKMRTTITPRDPEGFVVTIQMSHSELHFVTQAMEAYRDYLEGRGDQEAQHIARMATMLRSYLSMAAP